MRVYSRISASVVMVNDHTAFRVDWMPFAGLKQSGPGTGGIAHTMEALQIKKLRPQLTEPASLARAAWHPRPRFFHQTQLSSLCA
jgi:acyl-CoA reductase-like NAD-dependent aldehyde dehydrogenase